MILLCRVRLRVTPSRRLVDPLVADEEGEALEEALAVLAHIVILPLTGAPANLREVKGGDVCFFDPR